MTYVGIDPGVSGGIVALLPNGEVEIEPLDISDKYSYLTLYELQRLHFPLLVGIEKQYPRPTSLSSGKTLLKSSAQLYGQYRFLVGVMMGLKIVYSDITAQQWQSYIYDRLGILRVDKEQRIDRKRRYRDLASKLFPNVKVTLRYSDALLIARYLQSEMGEGRGII